MKKSMLFCFLFFILSILIHASTLYDVTVTTPIINIPGTSPAEVTLDPPGGQYTEGTVVTITAHDHFYTNSRDTFDHWSGALSGKENPTSFTVTGNMQIEANYIHGYWIPTPSPTPPLPVLRLTKEVWYTTIENFGITAGATWVHVKGYTDAEKLEIQTHGDGLTDYKELTLTNGMFDEHVMISFRINPSDHKITRSSELRFSKNGTTLIEKIESPILKYPICNAALNQPVFSSSEYGYPYLAGMSVDGDLATVWGSNMYSNVEWIYVDLGSTKMVDGAAIYWYESFYPKSYRIAVSEDLVNWQFVGDIICDGGYDWIEGRLTTRYIGLLMQDKNNVAIGISEFKVYEDLPDNP